VCAVCCAQVVGPSNAGAAAGTAGAAAGTAGGSANSPAGVQRRQQQQAQGLGEHGSPPESGQGLGGLLGLNSPPMSPMQRAALAGMQQSLLGSGTALAELVGGGQGGLGGVGSPGGMLLQGFGYGGDADAAGSGGNGGGIGGLVYGGGLGLGGRLVGCCCRALVTGVGWGLEVLAARVT
jgi:hypothetical protein